MCKLFFGLHEVLPRKQWGQVRRQERHLGGTGRSAENALSPRPKYTRLAQD